MQPLEIADRIWYTRLARINQSERLKAIDKNVKAIIVLYTLELLLISFVNSIASSEHHTIILTILLSGVSIYFSARDFVSQSERIKNSYIRMAEIIEELKDPKITEEKCSSLFDAYSDMLNQCDNHDSYDYYKALRANRKNKGEKIYERYHNLPKGVKAKAFLFDVYFFSPFAMIFLWFVVPSSILFLIK